MTACELASLEFRLRDDGVSVASFDHMLDAWILVTREDDEPVNWFHGSLVLP